MKNMAKTAILETVREMDNTQAEKVLEYIKGLLNGPMNSTEHRRFKEQALREIRSALKQG